MIRTTPIVFATVAALAQTIAAQQPAATLDRRIVPTAGRTPELRVPTWTKTSLRDGAQLVVSERHALPLVSFRINFIGGADQFEPPDKTGLADMVAAMMTEGTTHRSGDQLAMDIQSAGLVNGISVDIGGESGQISLQATRENFPRALALLSDVLLNPTFQQDAFDRLRTRTIVGLTQARDRTAAIASMVYPKLLYGSNHPYGRVASEASLNTITRDDLVSFYRAYFQPGRAVITVVGDVNASDVTAQLEKDLAGWARAGTLPSFQYPTPPAPKARTIYLVDKPGAAQSTFAIGEVGPPRDTPDYYALRVMNVLLGGMFQSRLNHDIREVKGYSYGVNSSFAFGKGPGAFRAGGEIRTNVSDSALIEFMREIQDIRGPRPPTPDEMEQARAALVQSLPQNFAAIAGVNQSIASIYVQGLPEDYYQRFARAVNAVTADDVVRVAKQYLDPDHLTILIVGDRAKIEAPLAATKIAPIVALDVNGNPVNTRATP